MPRARASSVGAGDGVGEDADRQLAVVGEGGHTHAEVAPQRHEWDGLEHAGAQHVERDVGPGHVRHDQVDERLVVDEMAGRRQCRRRQGVERGQEEVRGQWLAVVLGVPFGPGHLPQAIGRGCGTDREPHHHGGDVVAEPVVAVVIGPDRHEDVQPAPLHHLAPRREQIVDPTGDRRQEQVVEGDAEAALGPAELVHGLAHHDDLAIEADRGIEGAGGRDGRQREQAAEGRRVACQHVARLGRVPHGVPPVGGERAGEPGETGGTARRHGHPPRGRGGLPPVGFVRGRAHGAPGRAGRVASSTPARPSAMEWCSISSSATRPPSSPSISQMSHSGRVRSSRHDTSRAQSSSSWASCAGCGQRGLVDVVGDVEVGVVDPHRRGLAERREPDDLAQLGHEVQPALHLGAHLVEPEAPAGVVQRATLEDPDEAHVHRGVVRLHVEEGRIERRQGVGGGRHADLGGSGVAGRSTPRRSRPQCRRRASGCRARRRRRR